ncbi:conserved Plasmodium protein, unknown function [Plasmodium knowlesi strain H]|uniref:Uncharacterized protein n=3 Tax=Plasmodium knowlesi TaxID=5850 RepID=A0A5K1V1H1_PLAKH|nr:conserved Plasmodium protein, unknown function [Plasmodium knowlesi strain H]OTN68470.1 Uncharacterized protein PKNOH_S02297700 [Plasmodium knowlesi]CAA9986482.1 conserved Plasmodium protein, unknown function [Plasmodium knowlesi strain H]SBO24263.1 conserved Plasmodium protein, unknown function [Plasmodium knowlesi strain H]SBO29729.1 conserved Plasmodium protein, unknown function [Plasmodium knowlesi strain H]VVS75956.1 conserved Plasmodium protein, unknown function [Plasmodium knowlesi s|eukprot:XP_002261033.1 hypothetical protein, conserved in Plasmodium species [Plasmodium knowlesi strain H]
MNINVKRHIKPIFNIKNIFFRQEKPLGDKIWRKIIPLGDCHVYKQPQLMHCWPNFYNESSVVPIGKSEDIGAYQMRRDRGGTVRKKLSREKKKTQKKQKKEKSADVHK